MEQTVMKERGQIEEVDSDFTTNMPMGLRLDLACGERKALGFVGVDESQLVGVDQVVNLSNYPWPWDDNSVIEIRCSHYIEHVVDIKSFMEQAWRVMRNNGLITFVAPYYASIGATQDFTHVRSISEYTFSYFSQKGLADMKLSHYNVNADFDVTSIKFVYDGEWETRAVEAIEYARKHYWNVVKEIIVEMKCVKPGRFPVVESNS